MEKSEAMKKYSKQKISKIAAIIKSGGIGILPTDTIYGIVGSALDQKAVTRVYRLRHRKSNKPMIVLVGDADDLGLFEMRTDKDFLKMLKWFWPGKVSVVLRMEGAGQLKRFKYLHRGVGSVAFRLPKPLWLRQLLKQTGPLVAPSANLQGQPAARTIREAKKIFGKNVDFYLDAGPLMSPPSTLLKIEKGRVIILRKSTRIALRVTRA
jgi:L-threonylcarbamoyladenylate synthase